MLAKNVLSTYNVKVLGKGSKTMLFAHGLGCDQNVWKYITPSFEENYQIVLLDYIGSGQSDFSSYNKERHATLNGYAEDILDICRALQLNDLIFVGHSVSSMIGLLAAIKEPAFFSCLIMIGPSPYYINEPPYFGGFDKEDILQLLSLMQNNYIQWSGFYAPKVMGNADRPELAGALENLFCQSDPGITYEFAKVTFLSDNRPDLKQLSLSALILQPEADIVAPKHIGAYVHQQIPNSTLYNMEATGHFPHLSAVEETAELIKQYLKDVE